jgi:hypothetical protein
MWLACTVLDVLYVTEEILARKNLMTNTLRDDPSGDRSDPHPAGAPTSASHPISEKSVSSEGENKLSLRFSA